MNQEEEKQKDLFGEIVETSPLLRDRFLEPPFTILDTKGGGWQNRKRRWIDLGIKSEVGREGNLAYARSSQSSHIYEIRNAMRKANNDIDPSWDEIELECEKRGVKMMGGTSVFDPCLTELMYKWFCPTGGSILDPFAGGSVRGVVANFLGFKYTGIELRQEQVDSNRDQALEILSADNQPQYYVGDTDKVLNIPFEQKFDLLFGCPPYADLEIYSDDPDDLSNMPYELFVIKYRSIIKKAVSNLKPDSFAIFIVGDVRDKKNGTLRRFHHDTVSAFCDSGMQLYNEAILLTSIASASIRAGRQFDAARKLIKTHQNIYIFYNGNHDKIKERLGIK